MSPTYPRISEALNKTPTIKNLVWILIFRRLFSIVNVQRIFLSFWCTPIRMATEYETTTSRSVESSVKIPLYDYKTSLLTIKLQLSVRTACICFHYGLFGSLDVLKAYSNQYFSFNCCMSSLINHTSELSKFPTPVDYLVIDVNRTSSDFSDF